MKNWKALLKLALPIMLGMVLQSLQGTADMMFVSWLGTDQVAGVIYGNNIFGTAFMFSILITAGSMALISRKFGQKDKEGIKLVAGVSTCLALITGLIVGGIIAINGTTIIVLLFNPDQSSMVNASTYTRLVMSFVFIVYVNSNIQVILQAHGDTKTPLYIFGLGNVINIILDPILIFTLNLGVEGAAIATVISRTVSFILIMYAVINKVYGGSIKTFLCYFKLRVDESIRILKIGVWACLQGIARPITGMIMFRFVTETGGSIGTAAFGIGGQLFNYTFIALIGLSAAVSIKVGHKLGEGKIDEITPVIEAGIQLAFINMALFIVPYIFMAEYIFIIFKSEPEVVKVGVEYLRIVYIGLIFVVHPMIYGGVFKGSGDTLPPMISSIVANVVFKLLISYTLAFPLGMGLRGIWIGIAASVVIESILMSYYFKKNTWREKVI